MKTVLSAHKISYKAPSDKLLAGEHSNMILQNISFELYKNDILGISGESGSGKTTLAKILSGIISAYTGDMTLSLERDWSKEKTKPIQFLFQNSSEILNPIREVGSVLKEAIKLRFRGRNISELVLNSLRAVGLDETFIYRRGYELSGGEQQRVALARIISVEPEILILDEPFSAQDVESQLNFVRMIESISAKKEITLIIISHNLNILKMLCDRIMIISKGMIVKIDEPEKLIGQLKTNRKS